MDKEELKEIITNRFPNLVPILLKIIRLYEIVGEDCTGLNLRILRHISLRDLVRWCTRTARSLATGNISLFWQIVREKVVMTNDLELHFLRF